MGTRPRIAVAIAVLATSRVLGEGTIPLAALGPRTVRLAYEARYTPPAEAGGVELWLPLPREEDQRVQDLEVSGSAPATVIRLAPSGDRVARMRVERPAGTLSLRATATVARRVLDADLSRAEQAGTIEPAAFRAELAPSRFVVVDDEVRAIAARAMAGKAGAVARARALYDWVFDHMQYDKSVPGWGLGDVPYCLKVGKGNCTDFHTLFIALARASDIPARWNMGFPLAYGDGASAPATDQAVAGYHCWAEFLAPGAGWVPVDISEARKHPELKDWFFGHLSGNRILMSRARNFTIPGDPTPRNYLVYPIARVDGRDATGVEWTFRYSDVGGS